MDNLSLPPSGWTKILHRSGTYTWGALGHDFIKCSHKLHDIKEFW